MVQFVVGDNKDMKNLPKAESQSGRTDRQTSVHKHKETFASILMLGMSYFEQTRGTPITYMHICTPQPYHTQNNNNNGKKTKKNSLYNVRKKKLTLSLDKKLKN